MKSQLNEDFVDCFRRLPNEVKELARKNYRLWCENPSHPSLHFKRIHSKQSIYSVRVGIDYRALGRSKAIPSLGSGSAHTRSTIS